MGKGRGLKGKGGPPRGALTLSLDGAVYHPDAVLAAAHVLARRLRVWLRSDGRGGTRASLAAAVGAPFDAAAAEALFLDEAAAQELRRRAAAANAGLREYVVTQALLAAGPDPQGAPAPPPPGGDAELERLIAEAERELEDKAARFAQEGQAAASEESGGADAPGSEAGRVS